MNRDNEKHFGLRINGDILAKFRYVCGYVGRSANSQVLILIRDCIEKYEEKHGKIELGGEKKSE